MPKPKYSNPILITPTKVNQYVTDLTPNYATIFGGKGNGLLQMFDMDLPVPEFAIVTTEVFKTWRETGELPKSVHEGVDAILDMAPNSMFSVRSGAPVSMPGMMDTILNVGVNAKLDLKYDGSFRRFITSWLETVKGVPSEKVEELLKRVDDRVGVQTNPERWFALASGIVQKAEGVSVPVVRKLQILESIEAVFRSWDTPRAKAYRQMHGIDENMGTACVIQRMVMGNASGMSGSGVMFTRCPATGNSNIVGEIALNAQGEDVVSGAVTPKNIKTLPDPYYSMLTGMAISLEANLGDVQDIEFTFENGELFLLQTRVAKMSARARIITACDLAKSSNDPLAYIKERVTRGMVAATMMPVVHASEDAVTGGMAAAPGAVSGKLITRNTPLDKVTKDCILVAEETMPEDFPIMAKCGGILTKTGGFTCHSAVVARGIGVPAVVGVGDALEFKMKGVILGGKFVEYGMPVTIDGMTGAIYLGEHEVKKQQPPREIFNALHDIVSDEGYPIPEETYYYDCGLGEYVCLPLDPSDMDRVETQLYRAEKLRNKGKLVAFCFEFQGLGEDMFDTGTGAMLDLLAENYAPDLEGQTILYGVPKGEKAAFAEKLGVFINDKKVTVLDLLDLLG